MSENGPREPGPNALTLHVGKEELVIRQRYEVASIANDILIAVWFLIGSVMFFSPEWQTPGTWCFVFGSVELLVRPVLRLSRHLHLQRMQGTGHYGSESSQDF
ncbi:YrhK family protein [Streptomyces albidus (ex Kaewkla and Franco 2022)]|uniref:YrhK family protein n=1 Tax=Streptomyces albidus (ex Kaewkla and Franco 2022) TaxID=722709 RepID=UPI0015EF3611|nr:YrhK family protein [Streptomyces albidus (ex Kaewkla and Franco 2022)]